MKYLLILVTFLSFSGISFAVDYDSVFHAVIDRSKPFDDRYASFAQHMNNFSVENLFALLKQLASESKKTANMDKIIGLHATLARYLSNYGEHSLAKAYLDSVMIFENSIDHSNKAKLYHAVGNYYGALAQTAQAHDNYYKALENYEKIENTQSQQIALLYNIAVAYLHENDSSTVKTIIGKMTPLAKEDNTFVSHTYTNIVNGSYYALLYDLDNQQTNYIDSVLHYNSIIIGQYERIENPPASYALNISFCYIQYANFSKKIPNPNWDIIIQHIEKALKINPYDSYIQILYHHSYATYYSKMRQFDRALTEAMKSLQLLVEQDNEDYFSMYLDVYNLLSEIHEFRKEYEQALKYERLVSEVKFKIYNKERHQIVKDLQTQYEVEKKEEEIRQLAEQNRYRERINRLYLGMLILIALVSVFMILWFRDKRKADAAALQISRFQQQEAELKANIEAARFEEKESQYIALSSEMQMRQIRSYLEGLEAERARLAGELHDNVSNSLLSVGLKMRDPDVSTDEILGLLNGIQEHVRNISHELMPPVFQYAALSEIIADYVHMQNGMSGPRFEYQISPEDGWDDLPHETALELHRIIQESCGNALKHSGASLIGISLHRDANNRLRLTVSDNGRGMDKSKKKPGVGLQIIRDRAAKMNGTVEIVSAEEKGTKIIVNC